MSIAKKMANQSLIFFLGTVFSVVVGFFFKTFIARQLGAEMLGFYALGVSMVSILSVFISWGLGNGLVRFVSKYMAVKDYARLHNYIRTTLLVTLSVSLVLSTFFFLFPGFISHKLLRTPELEPYLYFFGILIIVNGLIAILDQIIRGLQEVKQSTLVGQFIRLPFKIGVAVTLILIGFKLEGYLWAEVAAALLALLLLGILVLKLLPKEMPRLTEKSTLTINKEERSFGNNMLINNSVGAFTGNGGRLLLGFFMGAADLGIYAIVTTITAFIPTILASVNAIFTPIISQLHSQNKTEELHEYYQFSAKYIFILTFPLVAFIVLFASEILSVFGAEFITGTAVLIVLAVANLISCMFGSLGMMLNMTGLDKNMRNIGMLTSTLLMLGILLLVPFFGSIGLGAVESISMILLNILAAIVLFRKRGIMFITNRYAIILVLFMALFFLLLVVKQLNIIEIPNPFILVLYLFLSYLIYFILAFSVTSKSEKMLIKEFLQSK